MDKLLPCPFCGGEADYHQRYDVDYEPYRENYIKCRSCGVKTISEPRHPDDGASPELIKAWNQRIKGSE